MRYAPLSRAWYLSSYSVLSTNLCLRMALCRPRQGGVVVTFPPEVTSCLPTRYSPLPHIHDTPPGSLSWYDPPGLRAVATCLPGLRQLQLDPPESACLDAAHQLQQQQQQHHPRQGHQQGQDTDAESAHTSPRWDLSTSSSTSSFPSSTTPPSSDTSLLTTAADDIEPPTCWLGLLLRLLSRYCPHLTSLRVHTTAADREGAEAAVRSAVGLLPRRLPRLEQLTLLVDLGQGCVLGQQQVSAEQYLREWAAWLRGQEQELQVRAGVGEGVADCARQALIRQAGRVARTAQPSMCCRRYTTAENVVGTDGKAGSGAGAWRCVQMARVVVPFQWLHAACTRFV